MWSVRFRPPALEGARPVPCPPTRENSRYEGRALDLIQGMKDGARPHIRSSSGYEGLQKVYLITGRYERGVGKGRALDLALPASILVYGQFEVHGAYGLYAMAFSKCNNTSGQV